MDCVVSRFETCADEFILFVKKPSSDEDDKHDEHNEHQVASVTNTTSQQCCEHVSIKYTVTRRNGDVECFDSYDDGDDDDTSLLNNFINQHVSHIKLVTDEYEEGHIEILFASGDCLSVKPVNFHNGYYPHDFVLTVCNLSCQVEVGKEPPNLEDVVKRLETLTCGNGDCTK